MSQIFAATSQEAALLVRRDDGARWSLQSSALAILGLSLLGWLAVGTAVRHLLSL